MGAISSALGSVWGYVTGVKPAEDALLNACNNFRDNPTEANQQAVSDAYANYRGSAFDITTLFIPDPLLIRPMVNGLAKSLTDKMSQQGIPNDALRALDQQFGSTLEGQLQRDQCEQALGDKFRSDLGSKINQIEASIANNNTFRIVYVFPRSPLVLDLDGDGIETVAPNGYSGTMFDLNGDGIRSATGWVGSDDGILVRDINGNGTIDDGTELFGDSTVLAAGGRAVNGYAALADMDSNGDGKMDANDVNFAQLQVWRDLNGNGVSDAGELFSLGQAGVQSINTTTNNTSITNVTGGYQYGSSSYTRTDGAVGDMADIYFTQDNFHSTFTTPITVPPELQSLPDIGGVGRLRGLQQAAALSPALVDALNLYNAATTTTARKALLGQVLIEWSKTDPLYSSSPVYLHSHFTSQSADSPNIIYLEVWQTYSFPLNDSGVLASREITDMVRALDTIRGVAPTTDIFGGTANPAQGYVDAFNTVADSFYNNLEEIRLQPLFDLISIQLNVSGFMFDLSGVQAELENRIASNAPSGTSDLLSFNKIVGAQGWLTDTDWESRSLSVLNTVISSAPMTSDLLAVLNDTYNNIVVAESGVNTSGTTLAELIIGSSSGDVLNTGGGNDTVMGGDGNDTITYSYNANNTIEGGAGVDEIQADLSHYSSYFPDYKNTIIGGTGNDYIVSGANADTYLYNRGDGQDVIVEATITLYGYRGADALMFGSGISTSDILVSKVGNDLLLKINDPTNPDATDQITIVNWNSGDARIEQLQFTDGSTLTSAQLSQMAMTGSAGVDTITMWSDATWVAGLGGDDTINSNNSNANSTIYGGEGNDTITDGYGNNTIDGGTGDDVITDSGGNNTLNGGGGNDVISAQNWGDNIINAGDGNDSITYGRYTNNTIEGGTGNDVIRVDIPLYSSPEYSNTISGAAGNDYIISGSAADTYLYNRGDGQDTISESICYWYSYSGTDVLMFGSGISTSDILVSKVGNDLLLKINDPTNPDATDQITIVNWNSGDARIEQLQFTDGSTLTSAQLSQMAMTGSAGVDTITMWSDATWVDGLSGDDTINSNNSNVNSTIYGGEGNDTITDAGGNDMLNGGHGNDTITDSNGSDTIEGGAGDDIITDQNSGTNILRGGDGKDTITYSYISNNTIEGGTGNDLIQVSSHYAAGGYYSLPGYSNTISGSAGNDYIISGASADTYLYNRWDGQDTISETTNSMAGNRGTDTLVFGAEITAGDILATRVGANLVLKINDPANPAATDQITIENWDNAYQRLEQLQFEDGSMLTAAQLANITMTGTDGADAITLWTDATWADGKGGNDTIVSGGSNATLFGGDGNDTITDSNGSDTIEGGAGNDIISDSGNGTNILRGGDGNDTITYGYYANNTIEGGAGSDLIQISNPNYSYDIYSNTIAGGMGDDRIVAGGSADTYLFSRGDGSDTISDYGLGNSGWSVAGTDKIVFGVGIAASDIVAGRVGANLVLKINDPANPAATDQITIENWFLSGGYYQIESVNFADGKVWNSIVLGTIGIDILSGTAGNDLIDGGTGADTLIGGTGNDTYVVDNAGDVVTETSMLTTEIDTVLSSVTHSLAANLENLTLTGTAAINGTGNTLNNLLDGSLNSAANVLTGGTGNDTYILGTGDTIVEAANAGTDTVMSAATYTLGTNLENLTLTGTAAINGTGNTVANILTGNSAANTLSGGTGADTLIGGLGNDTYVVDNTGDIVTELLNEGIDLVQSSVTYTLAANVDNLTLTGTTAINATGNADNNVLTGNSGVNTLTGGAGNDTLNGGTGKDKLLGGLGNDTYVVDNTGDVITELLNEGIDLVQSSVTYTLAANVDNITLTGTKAINATGNALDNVLDGSLNSKANVLTGGAGNDTYVLGTSDTLVEAAAAGIDTVMTAATYTLGTNLENLTLTGTAAVNGTGNTVDNILLGNSAVNTLSAGTGNDMLNGALGNDILNGDAGNDILLGGEGNDTLTDTAGNNVLDGGAGTDILTGNSGNELFIGGAGNDTLNTGNGADILAFNRGDGLDTVNGGIGTDNTLSLGKGINYSDIALSKVNNDLILEVGAGEQITLSNWYNSAANYKSVLDLQVMADAMTSFDPASTDPLLNKAVQNFDFTAIVNAYDQARVSNATLIHWNATNSLLAAHLSGSDTVAFGGDLAHQYGSNGTLTGMNLTAAQTALNDAQFGGMQTLRPLQGLQGGVAL